MRRPNRHRVNERINAPEVRVIDPDGKQLGILPTREALRLARERGVDLVEVAPQAEPPVCRLLDYGKFVYEQTKKEREARKKQKVTEVKEVRFRPKTDTHDVDFKVRRIRKFLQEGAKVKVRVHFRGREITYPELGRELLEHIIELIGDDATVEQKPRMEGPNMFMMLAPESKK